MNAKTTGQQGSEEPISVRHHSRSRLACDSCRRKKLKCDNTTPCRTCQVRKIPCITSSGSRRPGRPRHDEITSPVTSEPIRNDVIQEGSNDHPVFADVARTIEEAADHDLNGGVDMSSDALPEVYLSQDFTVPPQSFTEFDAFALTGQGLDFMSGLWQLSPMQAFDSSIDENSFSFFDESWLQFSGSVLDQPTDRALDMMREHFRQRSRAPSPSRVDTGQRQYSVAPNLARYDAQIINVFLNLGRNHLADSFPVYASFQAVFITKVELCLAMAAVGALYCTVPGSMKIARSLYHDARRLLLETYYNTLELNNDESWTHALTFILLELYGLCSGNKRSYEFTEVWHGCLLDATEKCLSIHSDRPKDLQDLKDSVQMLESYRVLILSLPPSISNVTDTNDEAALQEVMSPTSNIKRQDGLDIGGLVRLAGVINGRSAKPYSQLWKTEFIELALDRWLRVQPQETNPSQMLLFHMTHIYLHSNIPVLQRYAMARATSRVNDNPPNLIQSWITSQDYQVSRWHAGKIMDIVKRRKAATETGSETTAPEPPHVPYCLYFAVLVHWYGTKYSESRLKDDRSVLMGIGLLSGLNVYVASLLTMVLREMLPNEG